MFHRWQVVHEAIMRSPTDPNMEDIEDTMVIEANQEDPRNYERKQLKQMKEECGTYNRIEGHIARLLARDCGYGEACYR